MGNHHLSPTFGIICLELFPSIFSKSKTIILKYPDMIECSPSASISVGGPDHIIFSHIFTSNARCKKTMTKSTSSHLHPKMTSSGACLASTVSCLATRHVGDLQRNQRRQLRVVGSFQCKTLVLVV